MNILLRRMPSILLILPLICWSSEPAPAIYSGHYFYNFENAAFTPEGQTDCWKLKGDMSRAELPSKNGYAASGTADIVIHGTLGPAGHFGNLGSCTHVLTVLEIIGVHNKIAT
jgi:hypothetical protein